MRKSLWMLGWILSSLLWAGFSWADEPAQNVVPPEGKRPYELDWANRVQDEVPPLADFEAASGNWTVETNGMTASFELTKEQKIWGETVGKLTYHMNPDADSKTISTTLRPEKPLALDSSFDVISVWVYGNNWEWHPATETPRVRLFALFEDAKGQEFSIYLTRVRWKEWFLIYQVLTAEEQARLHEPGAKFVGFRILDGINTDERVLFFDNLAIRKEKLEPLTFKPRPKRNFAVPQQNPGLNTGEGTLPFPTRPETILPENKRADFTNTTQQLNSSNGTTTYRLSYEGQDGKLVYRLAFDSKMASPWSGISASWNGSAFFQPLAHGGVQHLADPEQTHGHTWSVTEHELVSLKLVNENTPQAKIETVWKVTAPNPGMEGLPATATTTVKYSFAIWGKTLVIETESEQCSAASVSYGDMLLENVVNPKSFLVPYYSFAYSLVDRPGALCFQVKGRAEGSGSVATDTAAGTDVVPGADEAAGANAATGTDTAATTDAKPATSDAVPAGTPAAVPTVPTTPAADSLSVPLFIMGHTDWYTNNGSYIYGKHTLDATSATFNGGTYYNAKTDGKRNPCYERFMVVISPDFDEVLPTIANPVSPWKSITGTHHWRSHGVKDREQDRKYWYNVHRHGVREVVVTDHETCFRDGGESFTFRTRSAPGKGGDESFRAYSDYMNRELGFVYGPYNNFTDFAPVNEYWSPDIPSRTQDHQLQGAWARCYAPKPVWAVTYCEKLSPINQEKFHFRTAYCDVHTAVTSSSRVDYDYRVPGAGTQAETFYAFGEIMLLQKKAWNGPVYSEGNYHFPYCGLTDGNYGQDNSYNFHTQPWLLNFDLRRLHDLCCNFGMGNIDMFHVKNIPENNGTPATQDQQSDRFFCATMAFGHPGFLAMNYGIRVAMRGYFNAQQLQSRYTQVRADKILYCSADGQLMDVSEAIANGVLDRSQVVVKYADGTVVCANGSLTETMRTTVDQREVELPPNGYTGWTADGQVFTFSGLQNGTRCDYAESPVYVFLDGRGAQQTFARATGAGCGVCRQEDKTHWEIITLEGAEMGFRLPGNAVSAVALDFDRNELGPAELVQKDGFVFVKAVPNAFSYMVEVD